MGVPQIKHEEGILPRITFTKYLGSQASGN
jgi:hypothetical protein